MTFIDPEMLLQIVPRLDALGFQAHFHALGDRAVRVGARCDRGRQAPERLDGHASAPGTPLTCRWSTRTTCRGSAGSARSANVQALWAVHEAQMDDLTLPGPRPGRLRPGSTRCGRSGRRGRDRGHGLRLVRLDGRPVRTDAHRRQSGDPGGETRPSASRSCPRRRSSWTEALVAFTAGSAYVSHLDEAGFDRRWPARRPRHPRPRPVRSRRRRDRRHAGRGHRGGRGPRARDAPTRRLSTNLGVGLVLRPLRAGSDDVGKSRFAVHRLRGSGAR